MNDQEAKTKKANFIKEDYLRIYKMMDKIPSREEYLVHGHYSKSEIVAIFGTFTGLKQYSGLFSKNEENVPSTLRKNLEKFEVEGQCKEYVKVEIMPWVGKYSHNDRKKNDHKVLLVGADFHDDYLDPFSTFVFIDTAKRIQPDYVCIAGDAFDFYELSSFNQDPQRAFTLQKQIDLIREKLFKPLREACPDAQIDFIIGNHEYRLVRFLMSQAQALASLRCLRFSELFGLDEFKINLVTRNRFDTNSIPEDQKNYKLYDGMYLVTHGSATTTNHAGKELDRWGYSGCSAHVHHYQKATKTSPVITGQSRSNLDGPKTWISMGCMCQDACGEEYVDGIVRWQRGFNIVHLFPKEKQFVNNYIEITNSGKAIVDGVFYDKKSK